MHQFHFAQDSARQQHGLGQRGMDVINRQAWRTPEALRTYHRLKGYTDPGEAAAIDALANAVRGRPLLDVGVGAGRTTELLLPISADYTAIDYTPEMAQACQARFPGVRVAQMDARDLSAFADGQFACVVFSFNGIDSVDREDRERVLREFRRVLQPGGLLLMSAHNRAGPTVGERPHLHIPLTWNPARLAWRTLKGVSGYAASLINYQRNRSFNETHTDWALMNCAAHQFGIVVMYTSLAEQKRQLERNGFVTEAVFDSVKGQRVTDETDTSAVPWLHYLARKA